MFAAPPRIEADVFAKIPAELGITGRQSHWAEVQFGGAETPTFLEGPSFDRAGNLWVVDIPWGRLLKITPAGEVSVGAEYDGEPNGLKFHKDGRGFICDHKHGIMVFDPRDAARSSRSWSAPRSNGSRRPTTWSSPATATCISPTRARPGLRRSDRAALPPARRDGRLECLLDNVPSPNGLVLNKAENVLFLAVTRANAIWKITLLPDGDGRQGRHLYPDERRQRPRRRWRSTRTTTSPSATSASARSGCSAPRGEPMLRIDAPAVGGVGLMTTNCAYGGPDNKTLYITESKTGTVLSAPMPVPGRAMFSHQD